jgi:lipoprotein signal peptidase
VSLGAGAAVAAFALDHATKALAIANVGTLGGGLAVVPGFNLVLHRNSGVGGVTDFLDFYIGEAHWLSFNLAATAIFCSVAVLLFWPRRHVLRLASGT